MIPTKRAAVSFVNRHGLLLVFPIKNKPEVPSLWNCFYPKKKMLWEWNEDGDDRVAILWHLRAELSDSRKVVYAKWFGGRATLFSFELFTALLSFVSTVPNPFLKLGWDAQSVIRTLEDDSPLPTKVLRMETGLEGKTNEGKFNKALKELWSRLLIVGFGEKEEGGFPSLAVGSSKLLFEELWDDSLTLSAEKRDAMINKYIPESSPFYRQFKKFKNEIELLRVEP